MDDDICIADLGDCPDIYVNGQTETIPRYAVWSWSAARIIETGDDLPGLLKKYRLSGEYAGLHVLLTSGVFPVRQIPAGRFHVFFPHVPGSGRPPCDGVRQETAGGRRFPACAAVRVAVKTVPGRSVFFRFGRFRDFRPAAAGKGRTPGCPLSGEGDFTI